MSATPKLSANLPLTDELAGVVARMSGLLLSQETVDTALGLLSALAQETVPRASGAGVSLVDERRRRSSGFTDVRVREADALQYDLDEGPCLTAAATRELVRIDDLGGDRRWPRWGEAALRLGLRAVMSAPLVAADRCLGAIKVYADQPGTFDRHSEQLLTLFSAQAAILVANVQSYERAGRLSAGMREAFQERKVVTLAKGVLMGRHGIDESVAFGMLLGRCEEDGTTMSRAARAVVESAVRRRR